MDLIRFKQVNSVDIVQEFFLSILKEEHTVGLNLTVKTKFY